MAIIAGAAGLAFAYGGARATHAQATKGQPTQPATSTGAPTDAGSLGVGLLLLVGLFAAAPFLRGKLGRFRNELRRAPVQ